MDRGCSFTGKHTSWGDSLGLHPNTRLKGDNASEVFDGVIFEANAISVSREDHCGADSLTLRPNFQFQGQSLVL